MSELLQAFAQVLRHRLSGLEVVPDAVFAANGINVEFPAEDKVISAWVQRDKVTIRVFFESLNREAWKHDTITAITPFLHHHKGQLHVIGQNVIDIQLYRYYKEPTLLNGEIMIESREVAKKVAHMLADATCEFHLKEAHLFMLGKTALPVPTRNMWVRRTKRRTI